MIKYYVVEVNFDGKRKKWEALGERHSSVPKALQHMEDIDLTFPTRITQVTRTVILAEKYVRTKNTKRKRVVKKKS